MPAHGGLPASQACEQRAEFGFRVLMILSDGEAERVFQQDAGGGGVAGAQEEFAEQNAGHHPVGAGGNAEPVVLDRLKVTLRTGALEGLCEAEAEERVFRLPGDEGAETGDTV